MRRESEFSTAVVLLLVWALYDILILLEISPIPAAVGIVFLLWAPLFLFLAVFGMGLGRLTVASTILNIVFIGMVSEDPIWPISLISLTYFLLVILVEEADSGNRAFIREDETSPLLTTIQIW